MTGFGTLSKKLKKLESKDLPVLKSKKSATGILQPIMNTIPDQDTLNESKWITKNWFFLNCIFTVSDISDKCPDKYTI